MLHEISWSIVIARSASDEAIQSGVSDLDCFVELVIGPATSAFVLRASADSYPP